MSERDKPEINASSMADIAFLLLIFFLVTATMDTEIGIYKLLSDNKTDTSITVKDKNVLDISLNANDELLIENDQVLNIKNLKQVAVNFIDNGGGTNSKGESCYWCNGKKEKTSSDHPEKALINFQTKRNTTYAAYISVHNEILAAYTQLRNDLSQSLYGKSFEQLEIDLKYDTGNSILAAKIDLVKSKYPQLIKEEIPNN